MRCEETKMSPYRPKPNDTSHVDLTGCQHLVEPLARNAHEIWAELRMKDGWTYGPVRDDLRKLHPCLVLFDEMPESDKAFDRAMVSELLKAAIVMGIRG
jgi:ryanodine receptor 2